MARLPLTAVKRVLYTASECEMVMWSPGHVGQVGFLQVPCFVPLEDHPTQTSFPTKNDVHTLFRNRCKINEDETFRVWPSKFTITHPKAIMNVKFKV